MAARHRPSGGLLAALAGSAKVHLIGREVAVRLMLTFRIVKIEIDAEPLTRLSPIAIAMQIHFLVFDRAPQPLDEDVVDPAALAVHADADAGALQDIEPLLGGELRTLIGVEDLRD